MREIGSVEGDECGVSCLLMLEEVLVQGVAIVLCVDNDRA